MTSNGTDPDPAKGGLYSDPKLLLYPESDRWHPGMYVCATTDYYCCTHRSIMNVCALECTDGILQPHTIEAAICFYFADIFVTPHLQRHLRVLPVLHRARLCVLRMLVASSKPRVPGNVPCIVFAHYKCSLQLHHAHINCTALTATLCQVMFRAPLEEAHEAARWEPWQVGDLYHWDGAATAPGEYLKNQFICQIIR